MKKLILTLLVATSLFSAAPSYAWNRGGNGYHGGYNGYRGGYNNNYRGGYNNNWIAPAIGGLIVGGIVGAAIAQPYYSPAPVYAPAPVYVQPDPVYNQQGMGYTPPPTPPYGYHHEQMLDNNCNCYVTVLVPN
jgi:hypothetical protein